MGEVRDRERCLKSDRLAPRFTRINEMRDDSYDQSTA